LGWLTAGASEDVAHLAQADVDGPEGQGRTDHRHDDEGGALWEG
jgi:hypothetical protein